MLVGGVRQTFLPLCYIIIIMAVGFIKGGRPYFVAELDYANDRELALTSEFFKVCSRFHYQETMQLSRALGVHERTVMSWKYKERFPSYHTALLVIDWVNRGKPVTKKYPSKIEATMF